ncbi:MAG: transglutaminase-like domain-containing protein [Planctomycetota bacterium]|nr:transglutaminase-like domain-containing protein [Planctomycetota bacterium]
MPSPTHATPRLARSSAPGSKAHIETLISLLEDDSPVVQAEVRGEFSRLGKTAYPALERAARSGPARRRARARQFLLSIARRRQVRRLIRYAARSKHDLETGLFLLDRHANPAADTRAHRRVLDIYGNKLHKRIQVLTPGEARVEAFVQFMAEEMGFAGALDDYHHPSNIYLSSAIERRTGMPLTLCAIYSFAGRRAGLQVGLLPFPGHVLLAVHEAGRLFILDPFGGGKLVDKQHCARYLAAHEVPYSDEYLRDASDTHMLLRHVSNLVHSCKLRGRWRDARDLAQVQTVLRLAEA